MKMYLFYDKTGVLREIINDVGLRQGNYGVNRIFVYLDSLQYSSIDALFLLPDGQTLAGPYHCDTFEESQIPFDRKRDLRYFKYFKNYRFCIIDLTQDDSPDNDGTGVGPLDQSGLVHASLQAILMGGNQLQLEVNFDVEKNHALDITYVGEEKYLSLADYQYLRKLVANVYYKPVVATADAVSASYPEASVEVESGVDSLSFSFHFKLEKGDTGTSGLGLKVVDDVSGSDLASTLATNNLYEKVVALFGVTSGETSRNQYSFTFNPSTNSLTLYSSSGSIVGDPSNISFEIHYSDPSGTFDSSLDVSSSNVVENSAITNGIYDCVYNLGTFSSLASFLGACATEVYSGSRSNGTMFRGYMSGAGFILAIRHSSAVSDTQEFDFFGPWNSHGHAICTRNEWTWTINVDTRRIDYTPVFVNGFQDDGEIYAVIFREDNELHIILSGYLTIDQSQFTPGAVQTPVEFDLDEATSRKLYVRGSNTAAGNVLATPGIYYNDINYQSTVTAFILNRISDGGNRYRIRFTGSALTDQSQMTDLNWRVTLAL